MIYLSALPEQTTNRSAPELQRKNSALPEQNVLHPKGITSTHVPSPKI
jgi:hypothetical protein